VVFHGVGVRVKPTARAERIRQSLRDVIASPKYLERARALGARIAKDARESRAVPVLEEIAAHTAIAR
jgi:UDP:flavonoid glycosyltransferase YjiC (YdhE family)